MTQPSTDSAALRPLRESAIQTWLRLYAGNDIDVAADVGRFFDEWPELAALLDERDRLREALKLLTPFEPQHAAECAHERFVTPPCDCGATAANHAARAALAQSEEARP